MRDREKGGRGRGRARDGARGLQLDSGIAGDNEPVNFRSSANTISIYAFKNRKISPFKGSNTTRVQLIGAHTTRAAFGERERERVQLQIISFGQIRKPERSLVRLYRIIIDLFTFYIYRRASLSSFPSFSLPSMRWVSMFFRNETFASFFSPFFLVLQHDARCSYSFSLSASRTTKVLRKCLRG